MKTEADTNSPQRVNRIDPRQGLFHSRSSYNSRYRVEIKNDTSTGRLDDSEAVVGVKRGGEAFPTSKRQESRARLNPSRPFHPPSFLLWQHLLVFSLLLLARHLHSAWRLPPPERHLHRGYVDGHLLLDRRTTTSSTGCLTPPTP